ncbi:MAG: hypothetical protein QXU82_00505 [Candidatus Aenigmatarchaeota archaeon]
MVETGLVACGTVMGVTVGGSLLLYHSTEFAKGEDRRVESEYREICEKYEGLTSPNGVRAFRDSMRAMFESAKERARNDGWLVYPAIRRMMVKAWQADIDVLDAIDPADADAYQRIRDVFKATGQWK